MHFLVRERAARRHRYFALGSTRSHAFSGWTAVLAVGRVVNEVIATETTRCGGS